jgi:hypothetical protein
MKAILKAVRPTAEVRAQLRTAVLEIQATRRESNALHAQLINVGLELRDA